MLRPEPSSPASPTLYSNHPNPNHTAPSSSPPNNLQGNAANIYPPTSTSLQPNNTADMTSASVTPGPASNHPHSRHQRTATPHSTTVRTPYSVGQSLPPLRSSNARSPSHVQDARTPSPNYFGLSIDPAKDCLSSGGGQHARANWSPPTSNVRSTAAASPRIIPLDQNPEFEAFRRQTELHALNAGRLSTFQMGAPPAPRRTSRPGSPTIGLASPKTASSSSPKTTVTSVESKLSETKQRSPKRLLSSPAPHFTDRPRRNSPAGFTEREAQSAPHAVHFLQQERDVRLSLPPNSASPPPPHSLHFRADTLPASLDDQVSGDGKDGGPALTSPQQVVSILESYKEDTLLLDLRVSTQYAKSRITGALNLCIPTTLLKRPSYNPTKLAENFKLEEQRRKFERWRSCKYIVVYDSSSSKLKDATPCVKMLEKFANEGWSGAAYIIRGGFTEFSRKFPYLVSDSAALGGAPSSFTSPSFSGPLPPVIGGCPMPVSENAANPFFGNIRQNMDLIGGVGQIPVKIPASMTRQQAEELPQWLRVAGNSNDDGKLVSEKFLHIEKKEQRRMQEALSDNVMYGSPKQDMEKPVQLAGIEKGTKNRYNNIWPFEHSRVKLQGIPSGGCDYINANHIKPEWSNKTYIATQGPIPATFKDFWNVVWQQDVRVIVMLTAEKEGGQLKAHNYWDAKHYGPLHVNFLSEQRASLEPSKIHRHRDRPAVGQRRSTNPISGRLLPLQNEAISPSSDQPYVTVRRFTLSHNDEPFARMREITQLQYSNWPDFGAPAHPTHLLGLVEQCDAVVRASSGGSSSGPVSPDVRPVLVHCSAGCGRTGTFCTVDSVIDMLKRQRKDGRFGKSSASSSDGNSNNQQRRDTRQPTPMDLDSKSRQPSFSFSSSSTAPAFGSSQQQDQRESNNWVFRDDIDLIEKTVEDFRSQRLSMVQSLRQFVLCYESVMEWWLGESQDPKSA